MSTDADPPPGAEPSSPTLSLSEASRAEESSRPPPQRAAPGSSGQPSAHPGDSGATPQGSVSASPSLAPPADSFVPPASFEHYQLLSREDGSAYELGRGAMGVTYKALDTRLHCHVALKVINAAVLAKHPAARERFLREARAAARLRHANVASIFHLGERAEDSQCFYAMEFIEGETLEERVRRRGPLPVPLALEVCTQVARALVAASQQGLVHRDLKPANLMLSADHDAPGDRGSDSSGALVKVIDFGLAKAVTDSGDLTGFGNFLGTPHYASPEQFAGAVDAPLDSRSDIYSLGVTFWYALTGKLPFPSRSVAESYSRRVNQPLPVEQLAAARVPQPIGELLASMLAVDPADRPPTPYALMDALRACRDSLPAAPPVATGWTPSLRPQRRRFPVPAALGLGLALLLAAAGAGYHFLVPRSPAGTERSIAVLPFENLSADQDNAFFADGVQDDVLTSLSKISELKVISRSSVLPYRDAAARSNSREIGRTLGVATLLEGTVRRAGNRMVISVKLISAPTGRQLWAEKYDRTLSDALSLQGEVASEIAAALRTTLSPEERARVASKPTGNADAYVLFLRGREAQTRAAFRRQDYEAAERLYEQAIALDENFALAHARLSQTQSQISHFFEPTAARQTKARASAETALRLSPDLGEGHLALALCYYWFQRDMKRGLEEFALASHALPNDADIAAFRAAILRRQNRWAESTAGFERALALNPRNADIAYDLANNLAATGNWTAATAMADRAVALTPDAPILKLWRGEILSHWKGDLSLLKAALAEMPAGSEQEEMPALLRYQVAMIERDDAAAESALAACKAEVFSIFDYGAPRPKSHLQGLIPFFRRGEGDEARARELLDSARPVCEKAVLDAPADPYRHAQLGLLYAALGWRDAALGEAWRAAELLPEKQDASDGPLITLRRAQIFALLGDAEGTVPLVEHLLKIHTVELFTRQDLRMRPDWDRVRNDPRFQKLLAASDGATEGK